MSKELSGERSAFEAWATTEWGFDKSDSIRREDTYDMSQIRAAWDAWQAAIAHKSQGAAPVVVSREAALAAIEDFEIVGENNASRDPTDEERFVLTEFVVSLFEDIEAAPDAAPSVFDALKAALQADSSYAWSWHCNFAMTIMDSIHCTPEQANKAAADLMQYLFKIDVRKFSEWHHE